jgi:hypothetical protein
MEMEQLSNKDEAEYGEVLRSNLWSPQVGNEVKHRWADGC